jgi:hypothetical protein
VPDPKRLYPALLTVGKGNEVPELDDLIVTEVLAELRPHAVVGSLRVPHQHAGIEERCLLSVVETVGALELEQLVIVLLD